ncbi:zinc finger protein 595-like isoform X1 [Amphibalanus amphitrite]|uniref:zinc finger protein 595-like isoform X1 n=1 Tax=Amphibalanus amphitrite TaxID=1232801 RepID=UPI001C8FF9C2|nr:zinc finger protein 595-like isoform X1 [Amphibalanus amphitrite]
MESPPPSPGLELKVEPDSGPESVSEPQPDAAPECDTDPEPGPERRCAVCGCPLPAGGPPPQELFDLRLSGGRPAASAVLPLRRLDVTSPWRLCAPCTALLESRERLRAAAAIGAARAELDDWVARVLSGAGGAASADSVEPAGQGVSGCDRTGVSAGSSSAPTVVTDSAEAANRTEHPATAADECDRTVAGKHGADASETAESGTPCDRPRASPDGTAGRAASAGDLTDRPQDSADPLGPASDCGNPSASTGQSVVGGAEPCDQTDGPEQGPSLESVRGASMEEASLEQQLADVERQLMDRVASAPGPAGSDQDLVTLNFVDTDLDGDILSTGRKGSSVLCNLCGEKFSGAEELRPHLESHKEGRQKCPVCHIWIRKTAFPDHLALHSDDRPFKCDMCSFSSKIQRKLRVHRQSHSKRREKHACPLCPKQLISKHGLKLHLLRHSGSGAKHQCPHCPKRFLYPSFLKSHISVSHEGKKPKKRFFCDICQQGFVGKALLELHISRHSNERKFKCKLCDKAFKCKYSLASHEKHVHSKEPKKFECEICGHGFSAPGALNDHKEIHKPDSERIRYQCEICNKLLSSQHALSTHKKRHGKEKSYKCNECSKTFYTGGELRKHMVVHSEVHPFKCALCEKSFKSVLCLNVHMRRHGTEKGFKCSKCPAAFKTSSDLAGHMMFHNTEKRFACEQCDAKFVTSKLLKQHTLTHSDVRDFACQFCSFKAKTKYILKGHERTHLAREHRAVFSCTLCENTFLQKVTLEKHVKETHSSNETPKLRLECGKCHKIFHRKGSFACHQRRCGAERKFACEECMATFTNKYHLNRHIETHSNSRQFACQHCSASYKARDSLVVHIRSRH